jgi:hypothetical protein
MFHTGIHGACLLLLPRASTMCFHQGQKSAVVMFVVTRYGSVSAHVDLVVFGSTGTAAPQRLLLLPAAAQLLQVVSATSARALRAMDINPGDIHLGVVGEDPLDPLLAWLGVSGAGQVASSSQDGAMVSNPVPKLTCIHLQSGTDG